MRSTSSSNIEVTSTYQSGKIMTQSYTNISKIRAEMELFGAYTAITMTMSTGNQYSIIQPWIPRNGSIELTSYGTGTTCIGPEVPSVTLSST